MRIKGWKKFQHFKDRRPIWIKLYRDILDDIEWHELDGASAKYLVMMWLIASEDNGELPPIKELSFRLRITENQLKQYVTKLGHWLEESDISLISNGYQLDALEKRREETDIKYQVVINDLNTKGGFNYKLTDSVRKDLNARFNEGHTEEDFFKVHTSKIAEWGNNDKMRQYLRPATLYCASKFQGYLNTNPAEVSAMAGVR